MSTFVKMAWRNIWRNKRRSLITMASIVFSTLLALLMRSMQEGTYGLMVDSVVGSYTGYIQVSGQGFRDDRTLDRSIEYTPELTALLEGHPNVSHQLPRMESFALASAGRYTRGVMVTGVDPQAEDAFTGLAGRVRQGQYLTQGDGGAMVGSRLARYLGLGMGDTLVLLGQGYQGVSAAGLFPIRAIVEIPSIELDNSLVYLTLSDAQHFFNAYHRVTSVAIDLHNPEAINATQRELKALLDAQTYDVERWDQILTELVQMIESDRISGVLMLYILYIVIGFGVLGTLLMMAAERRREFGMMMAVGMRRTRIAAMLALEILFLTLTSLVASFALGIPMLYYFYLNPMPLTGEMASMMESYGWEPILPFALEYGFMLEQVITVSVIALVAGAVPVINTLRLRLMRALRA